MSSYGLWLSAAGMKINEHRQNVLANNMANAQTTGFKRDLAVISARRVESRGAPGSFQFAHPVLDGLAGGVHVRPTHYSLAQGPLETTGRALDVAIRGNGFFEVSDAGATRYTRNGSFALTADGDLTLSIGGGRYRPLDVEGRPIRIEPNGLPIGVSDDGTIRQGDDVIARLSVKATDEPRTLRKLGEGLFQAAAGSMKPVRATLTSGALEGSNFNAVQGLATMIESTRAYQMNATVLQLQDAATDRAVNTVGRLP